MRKRVAIVSPYFPPSNLAGVHRARLLAAHIADHSWEPIVICVHERHYGQILDDDLSQLVPRSVRILKTGAIPAPLTRRLGIRDIGLRAFWHLQETISALFMNNEADLLFITASPFYDALLGPKLKKKFKIPFVMDFQDPWVSRWGAAQPAASKAGISHRLATWLEPRVLRHADHVTSVSDIANDELRARYPKIPAEAFSSIPIGGDSKDFTFLKHDCRKTQHPTQHHGQFRFSYVGTLWPRSTRTLRAILEAVALIKIRAPNIYKKLHLNFIGTSGQPDGHARFTVTDHARQFGVSDKVTEIPQRVPYLSALAALSKTDTVLLIGSDEPHYSASKLYTCMHAGKPFLAVFHRHNNACGILKRSGGGRLVTFTEDSDHARIVEEITECIADIVMNYSTFPMSDTEIFESQSASFTAGRYAALFDKVVANGCRGPWW